jgi:hypothetical protein
MTNPNLPQGQFSIVNQNGCAWCWGVYDSRPKKEFKPAFATIIMHCCGPDYYYPICKDCLILTINQQIEDIRENVYEGIELNDRNHPYTGGNREPLELQLLRDICFLGLN